MMRLPASSAQCCCLYNNMHSHTKKNNSVVQGNPLNINLTNQNYKKSKQVFKKLEEF